MTNRTLTFVLLLFINNLCFAQIENATNFIDFAQLSPQEKQLSMANKSWKGIGTDQYVQDGKVYSDMNYSRTYQSNKYFLLRREVVDINNSINTAITKLTINSETVFNKWLSEFKKAGINLKKVPDKENSWIELEKTNYVLTVEKRKIKDMWIYEFTMII